MGGVFTIKNKGGLWHCYSHITSRQRQEKEEQHSRALEACLSRVDTAGSLQKADELMSTWTDDARICEVKLLGKEKHMILNDFGVAAASMQDLKSFKCGEHVQTLQAHSTCLSRY